MASAINTYINRLIARLAQDGERIMRECERERTYNHDTHNLYDSYAYGVYYEGALVAHGYLSASMATERKKWYGREIKGRDEIDRFLAEYDASRGMELVIAAAMPYAQVLESRKYRVVAMAYGKLKEIKGRYGASVHYIANGIRQ